MVLSGRAALLAAAALLLLLPAHAQMSPGIVPSPAWPTGPCAWSGTSSVVCTGEMDEGATWSLLSDLFEAVGQSGTVSVKLSGVNMTGLQVSMLRAASYSAVVNPSILLTIENSVISKNQFVLFGALAFSASLGIDLQVLNSQVLDNQLVAAAGIVAGGAGRANLNLQSSEIRGNMVSSAGALAVGGTASAAAAGSGGSATSNLASLAGFIATGSSATAQASLEGVPSDRNAVQGAGLPHTEDPLVSYIISTVMNAVFVDSSTLPAGLSSIQQQLCTSMSAGGRVNILAEEVGLQGVLDVAWELLCDPTSTSQIKLSDIPAMLDGTAGPEATGTFGALKLLAAGKGHVQLKSLRAAWSFAMKHPKAAAELLSVLSVTEPSS